MENHHLYIHVSTNTNGDEFLSISDAIFSSLEDLYLQGINPKPTSNCLKYPFMGWDTLSIQDDPKILLIHTSLVDNPEEVSFHAFEPLIYPLGEKQGQYECHTHMPFFVHYTNDNDIDSLHS